jgi:hypothetical protein
MRDKLTRRDFYVSPQELSVVPVGEGIDVRFRLGTDGIALVPTKLAHTQIADYVGIPQKYYKRMLAAAPELLAENIGRWLKDKSGPRLLRSRVAESVALRAFLSKTYRMIDNAAICEAILPFLSQPGWSIKSATVNEEQFYIQAVTERVQGEVRKGDVVQAGVVIQNSEVGSARLRVSGLIYRLVCTNGMIVGNEFQRTHIGASGLDDFHDAVEFFSDETRAADDAALLLKLRDAVVHAVDQANFDRAIEALRSASTVALPVEPFTAVDVTSKLYTFSDSESKSVLQHLLEGGDLTQYGLANAVTRSAQDVDYDRAIELEAVGGDIIARLPKFGKN